jgi:hypothetical protein
LIVGSVATHGEAEGSAAEAGDGLDGVGGLGAILFFGRHRLFQLLARLGLPDLQLVEAVPDGFDLGPHVREAPLRFVGRWGIPFRVGVTGRAAQRARFAGLKIAAMRFESLNFIVERLLFFQKFSLFLKPFLLGFLKLNLVGQRSYFLRELGLLLHAVEAGLIGLG